MTATLEKTEEWHKDRKTGIGSSDAGSIVGLGFDTPYQLWEQKLALRPDKDLSGNDLVHWGTVLEDPIADEFARRHPELRIRRARQMRRSKQFPWACSHLDRRVTLPDGTVVPLEIKTAGRENDWGPSNSAEIPDYHMPQTQHHLAVMSEAPFAYVAVLIAGHDYREYLIPRDDTYITWLMEREEAFYRCMITRVPPALSNADDVIAKYPKPVGTIEATEDAISMVARLHQVKTELTALEAEAKTLRDDLALVFGNAEALVCNERIIATFKYTQRSSLDGKRLKAERPEIAEEYTCTSSGRMLLLK